MLVPEEITLLVSSDPNQGAQQTRTDGSSFSIQLDDPIFVPKDAKNITVAVEEATVWWTIPNILTGVNDKMFIYGDDVSTAAPQLWSITLPQGLYGVKEFNNTVQSLLEAAGARVLDSGGLPLPLVVFTADNATQKLKIRFNYTNVYVDFAPALTPYVILGFNQAQYGPYAGAPVETLGPNVAEFNQVNYFLIHSDLVSQGIRFNNEYSQVVSQVLIDVLPGSQIVSKPYNPSRINAKELGGSKRSTIRFWLTDESNNLVNTNGEYWSARMSIKYLIPYHLKGYHA